MAEGQRMTAARGAVEEIMRSEHADVLRESVAWAVRQIMEAEVAAQVGAELGERAPRDRSAQRNRLWARTRRPFRARSGTPTTGADPLNGYPVEHAAFVRRSARASP